MGFKSFSTADFLHNLLSVTHPDTVPASPVAGDLIFGNATPAWQRLPVGTNGYVLGVTSGVPTWMPAPSIGEVSLFFTDAASDIGGYKALSTTLPPEATATVGASIGGAGVAIEEWASPTSFHTPVFVPSGTWTSHVHVQRTAGGGQAQVFAGLYRRTHPGAVETLLGTMGPFNVDDNNVHEEDIDVSLPDTIFATTDRLVLKYYANKVVGSGSDPTVTLSYRGDTGSRLDFPVSTTSLDHGLLAGLADDDHLQYALLAGRAGGQTLYGGNAANDDLVLEPTAHATKTSAYITLAVAGGLVGIGTATPAAKLAINGGLHVGSDSDPGDNNLLVDNEIRSAAFIVSVPSPIFILDASGGISSTTLGNRENRMRFLENAYGALDAGSEIVWMRADVAADRYAVVGSLIEGASGTGIIGSVVIGTKAAEADTVLLPRVVVKASGVVNMPALPTSAAGLVAGDLWVDTTGGLNIVKRV